MKYRTMTLFPHFSPVLLRLALALAITSGVIAPRYAVAADDLCPDVDSEKHNNPGGSADIQASIEKLTLCVERARLLKQLDDIARQREDILNKVTDPVSSMPQAGAFPALNGASLPPLPTDISGLRPGDVRVTGAAMNPLGMAAVTAPAPKPEWKVRRIWGQGNAMRAQLGDGTGTLLNVVKGDTLPDGRLVEAVSVKGVAVSQNGKVTDLPWDDSTPDSTASK